MTFTEETTIQGAVVVDVEPRSDDRGFFARAWCEQEFEAHGLNPRLAQANLSYNRRRGTLRGLHYQAAPYEEAKLVRCIRGAMYDVIVDLRRASSTYLHWAAVELSADNRKALYVPEGCAHGFQTLDDDTEVLYLITHRHIPHAERGVRWDDPVFNIAWPHVEHRVMSAKDLAWPPFAPAGAVARR